MHRLIILLFLFVLPCSPTFAIPFEDSPEDPVDSHESRPDPVETDESPPDPIQADESSPDVFGDDFVPGILCDDCRDPYEYPMDFVALAHNAFFGDEPWLSDSDVSWPFRIYNLDGDWVAVWFENIIFDMPSLLPDTMDVMVRFENGLVVPYSVIQDGPDLPIGPDPEPESGSADCSCGGGGGDDDDYSDPEEEWEWEEPEYEGVVEIVDPDDDGEYPDFYEEL